MAKRLLFLGYERTKTHLIDVIEGFGWSVVQASDRVEDFSEYDLVVSFGYRYILKDFMLKTAKRPVLNLHIGYLPWNRGAHPFFWAMYDGSPAGVTIHEIDAGVDTGPICFQTQVQIDQNKETFETGYRIMIDEMESLFIRHAPSLLDGTYIATAQVGEGSLKKSKNLPVGVDWSEVIATGLARLKAVG